MTATEPHLAGSLGQMLRCWSVQRFYAEEAALLDERRLDEWLALWHPEARYWAPTRRNSEGRPDATVPGELGLFEDNLMTLGLRVASMRAKSAWAEIPPSRTRRLVTNVRVLDPSDDPDSVSAASNFLLYRSRLDAVEHLFVGSRTDRLVREGDSWRIRERMVLLDHSLFRTDNISVLF
jgi:3-phenylpropionate/cinnamic acid dioxygenase small subunit